MTQGKRKKKQEPTSILATVNIRLHTKEEVERYQRIKSISSLQKMSLRSFVFAGWDQQIAHYKKENP